MALPAIIVPRDSIAQRFGAGLGKGLANWAQQRQQLELQRQLLELALQQKLQRIAMQTQAKKEMQQHVVIGACVLVLCIFVALRSYKKSPDKKLE
jgi:hypothetical protein